MKNQLLDKWSDRGAEVARQDTWMEPCYEEDAGRAINTANLLAMHRQAWEGTDHFQILYGHEMRQDITNPDYAERDLLDVFWDAWELEIGAYDLAREAMETA